MADVVAAPAPPEAPAVEPGKNQVADDYNVLQFDDAPVEPTPVEVPEAAAVEPETPTQELKLKELRKKDSAEFDETLIEKVVVEGKQTAEQLAQAKHLYANDPEFRVAYLKAWQKQGGQLSQGDLAEIQAFQAPAAPKPVEKKPEFTEQQWQSAIDAKAEEMLAAGESPVKVNRWIQQQEEKNIHGPKREAERAAREKSDKEYQERTREAADVAKYRPEFEAAVTSYPDIVEPSNNKFGYWFKEKEIGDMVIALNQAYKERKPVKELIGMALKALGKDQKPKAAVTPTTRPAVAASSKVTPISTAARKPGKNEVVDPDVIILDVK